MNKNQNSNYIRSQSENKHTLIRNLSELEVQENSIIGENNLLLLISTFAE